MSYNGSDTYLRKTLKEVLTIDLRPADTFPYPISLRVGTLRQGSAWLVLRNYIFFFWDMTKSLLDF